ncbi:MAG: universal stress protein [Flavobacteriaceae bacterium]|nr:universal stress protein [Flavobacteriaceae bacterium]
MEIAESFDSKVWLMHVSAPDPDFIGYEPGPQYTRDFRAKELRKEHRLLESYVNKLKKKGIHAEWLFIKGATTEMIIKESKKLNIDLIIVGHHDYGFIYKAFFSSVSAHIIKKSKIPVLVIPFK